MGKSFNIALIVIAVTLYSVTTYAADNKATRHVSALLDLIDNSLNYSKEAPNDSIIQWGNELAPLLKKQKEYKTLFQLKQLIVTAYASRGDMNMAIDHARRMYKEAKELNSPIGIALSSRAFGDAYLNANMQEPAIESYKEALELLDKIPGSEILEQEILPKFILTLIQTSHMDEVRIYLQKFENLYADNPNPTFHFFICACNAYYNIESGDPEKGKAELDKARKIHEQLNYLYLRSIYNYILAQYYQAVGKYELALQQYERLTKVPKAPAPNKHIGLQLECAQLLTQMGRTEEAYRIYQKANRQKDSLNALSYARQINDLRGMYQIDRMEIRNQIQRNQIILWIIIASIFILMLVLLLIVRIRQESNRLLRSKEELEIARKYAENSIRTKSLFLSNMSHEIRTPLNALSGFSSILTDESIDNDTRYQCNDIIQQNSELLLKLINDVIDLSNLDPGKLTFNFKECDAVNICRNVINTVEKVKQTQAGVSFVTSLDKLTLRTDEARLKKYGLNHLRSFDPVLLMRILSISCFTMLQYFLSMATWFVFFVAVERLGQRELAIANIVRSIYIVMLIPVNALATTTNSLVSNAIGAGGINYVMPLINKIGRFSFLIMLGLVIITALFPQALLSVYTNETALINESVSSVYVICVAMLIASVANVVFNGISGTGNTQAALMLEAITIAIYGSYIIFIGMWVKAPIEWCFTIEILYYTLLLATSYIYFKKAKWQNKKI